jgi:hypothetical protein
MERVGKVGSGKRAATEPKKLTSKPPLSHSTGYSFTNSGSKLKTTQNCIVRLFQSECGVGVVQKNHQRASNLSETISPPYRYIRD